MWVYSLIAGLIPAAVMGWWCWRRLDREDLRLMQLRRERDALERDLSEFQGRAKARELAVLNSMEEGVLLLDREGRVRLSNRAVNAMFGVRAEILGQTLLEAFRLDGLQEVFKRVIRSGAVEVQELELHGEESRLIQVSATLIPGGQEQNQGVLLECRDMTRVRQLENTRREFVANVSHELRTPLSLIKGYAETLLQGAKDDPQVSEKFLRTIERHADRLAFLIEDLLTLSRYDSGQVAMHGHAVGVSVVVDQVVVDLSPRSADRGVRVVNAVGQGVAVISEAGRLQQVFFNLIDNAVKYGRVGGNVCVEAVEGEPGWVEVRVIDDGPGIPEAALERVFERFYRVDKARSRDQGGTGLGLAIVKHIVQCHGGRVWATSRAGEGTTFYFTLPAAAL